MEKQNVLEINQQVDLKSYARRFLSSNTDFKYVVIDNFLSEESFRAVSQNFPTRGVSSIYRQGYLGDLKHEFNPNNCSEVAYSLVSQFSRPSFLNFLETITSQHGLIPDPYYLGGGFHATHTGGRLGMHTDFRRHEKLRLLRKLNVLLYLNERWDCSWGGALRLESKEGSLVAEIFPNPNRLLIMETNDLSWHGHPDSLRTPNGIDRRSLALYYYIADNDIVPELNTMYRTGGLGIRDRYASLKNNLAQIVLNELLPPILSRRLKLLRRKIIFGNRKD